MSKLNFYDLIDIIVTDRLIGCVVFIYGEEPYFVDVILRNISDLQSVCDVSTYFGDDVTIDDLLTQSYQTSILSNRQVIIVRDAQNCQSFGKKESQEKLKRYIANPNPNTTFVFVYNKQLPTSHALIKAFDGAFVFNSSKLTQLQVCKFIQRYCDDNKFSITGDAVSMMYAYLGNDLRQITGVIDGMSGNVITCDLLRTKIRYSREFNAYELLDAIANNNSEEAVSIISQFDRSVDDMISFIGLLYLFFSKLLIAHTVQCYSNDFMLMRYKGAIKYYDVDRVKGIMTRLLYIDEHMKGVNSAVVVQKDSLKSIVAGLLCV